MTTTGKLLRIFLRPSARTPVREVSEAVAIEGQGLDGDHAHGGKRQVTLLSREGWEDALRELGAKPGLSPGGRRANLVVEGVDLSQVFGKRLRVGEVEVEVAGETRPCQLMDDVVDGLWTALKPRWRGGVFARIVTGGTVRAGDAVEVLVPASRA